MVVFPHISTECNICNKGEVTDMVLFEDILLLLLINTIRINYPLIVIVADTGFIDVP